MRNATRCSRCSCSNNHTNSYTVAKVRNPPSVLTFIFGLALKKWQKKSEWSNQSERMIAYCIIYRSIQTSIKNRHQLADVYPTLSDCFTTKLDCTPTIEFSPICWTESILADNKRPGFFLTFITQKIKQGFFLLRYAFLIRRQFKFSICVGQF